MTCSFSEMFGLACLFVLVASLAVKIPYRARMLLIYLGAGVSVLACIPFMIFRPRDYRNALMPAWALRKWCKFFGVTMEVRGLENVNKDHGSVVIMNHQSALDLCVLAYLWPVIGRATVVSKKEVLYLPFFGIGAWLWGTLFINRAQKHSSIKSLQQEAAAINNQSCKLLFFPEGTRNSTPTLLPFKKGCFHTALQCKCPIQPVVISKYNFLLEENNSFRAGHVTINILPEISTDEYSTEKINSLVEKCQNLMQMEFTRLSGESVRTKSTVRLG